MPWLRADGPVRVNGCCNVDGCSTLHPACDPRHDTRHVLAREPPRVVKDDDASIHRKHAVQHERVEVDVEIECAAEALHDRHGATPAVGDALTSGAMPQEPEHCTQCDAGHGPTQLVIPREQVPRPMRQLGIKDLEFGIAARIPNSEFQIPSCASAL